MNLFTLLRRSSSRRPATRSRATFRPTLEGLEDRQLMNATVMPLEAGAVGLTSHSSEQLSTVRVAGATFDWAMEKHFSNLPAGELPNDWDYVHPKDPSNPNGPDVYGVFLKGSLVNPNVPTGWAKQYHWDITDGKSFHKAVDGQDVKVYLPQGDYYVTLTVMAQDGAHQVESIAGPAAGKPNLQVKNILIVSLGDSYASGQGNPEKDYVSNPNSTVTPAQWATAGDKPIEILPQNPNQHPFDLSRADYAAYQCITNGRNNKSGVVTGVGHEPAGGYQIRPGDIVIDEDQDSEFAHRSTKAAPDLVAKAIEEADPHVSVTFVSLASTGTTYENGILSPQTHYNSLHQPVFTHSMSQLERLQRLVGDRHIDYLMLSLGGNDVGFEDVVMDLATDGVLGDPNQYSYYTSSNHAFTDLATHYADLNAKLTQSLPGGIGQVYVTSYPDPTRDRLGDTVKSIELGSSYLAINQSHLDWARNNIIAPLNATVEAAADRNGWHFVGNSIDGLPSLQHMFWGHAYGGTSDGDGWINTYNDSESRQDDVSGALHPALSTSVQLTYHGID